MRKTAIVAGVRRRDRSGRGRGVRRPARDRQRAVIARGVAGQNIVLRYPEHST